MKCSSGHIGVLKFLLLIYLQVPINFVVSPVPLLSEIGGGTCPRQLCGVGATGRKPIAFVSDDLLSIIYIDM